MGRGYTKASLSLGVVGLAIGVVLGSACDLSLSFECTSQRECVLQDGGEGQCQPDGFCSFADTTCTSGQRYGRYSGPMSGDCVALDQEATAGETTSEPSASTGLEPDPPEPEDSTSSGSQDSGSTGLAALETTDTGGEPSTSGVEEQSDLVLWLDFERLGPGGTPDASPWMSEGTCGTRSCPTANAGAAGQGAQFDGNDNLWVHNGPHFDTSEGLTVSAWIRLDAQPTSRSVIAAKPFAGGSANSWELFFGLSAGQPKIRWGMNVEGTQHNAVGHELLPLGTWVHIAGTWDRSISRLWVDGHLIDATVSPGIDLDDHPVIIGADDDHAKDGLVGFFQGGIDELRIYRRALDQDEILSLVEFGSP